MMGIKGVIPEWLTKLPSTNFQVLVSAFLATTTSLVVYHMMLQQIPIDPATFAMWLGFVAAYGGIVYKQFAKKRETNEPEMVKAMSDAKIAEAVASGTAVAVPAPLSATAERLAAPTRFAAVIAQTSAVSARDALRHQPAAAPTQPDATPRTQPDD